MLTLLSSIETALVNTGDVIVVDRASQESLAREIGIQQGAIYDPSSAQRLGRQLGAQYFFTGKITSIDENSSQEVSAVLGYLRKLAVKHEVAVLVVHHANKASGGRVGTAWRP